jgi:F-type H+-transporting ATPase subunit gamma
MTNLRDIRRRIASIRSMSKITQAMKLVAAAKLRRAQDAVVATRPYAARMRALMAHLLARVDRESLPVLFQREQRAGVLLVVVTADRGLCGAFNTNIIKLAVQRIHEHHAAEHAEGRCKIICVGRRGYNYFVARDYEVIGKHIGVVNAPSAALARAIMAEVLDGYTRGTYDTVEVVYNEFKSVIHQLQRVEQLLPVPADPEPVHEAMGHQYHEFTDYIYEPSAQELMETLVPKHLAFQMLRILCESNAAEQGARMTAMDAATSNTRDLIEALQLQYNSARQAGITKELLEIVGGAEALKKADA